MSISYRWGHKVAQLVKVAGSITDGVNGPNISGHTMALGLTQL
jgi:hypothetical protein